MTDPQNPRRRYGEKEVGLILKRATELQRNTPELTERSGLTLADLEEIALEAGIDPRFLRAAADELDRVGPTPEGVERWLGGPLTVELQRSVPGEVPPDEFDRFIEAIAQAAGGQGQPSVIGRTLSWTLSDPNRQRFLQVTVRSRDGETEIRIEERMMQLAGAFYGGIVVGGGVGVGLGVGVGVGVPLGLPLFAVLWPLGAVGGAYALARHLFGKISRKRQRILIRLLDQLTELVEGVATSPKRIGDGT